MSTGEGTGVPVRSMTGFGEADLELSGVRIRADIRTVNHRHLNVQLRTPDGYERHHSALESVLREYFQRGHVSVKVGVELPEDEPEVRVEVDLDRARGYRDALRSVRSELEINGDVELAMLAGFRDLFRLVDPGESVAEVPVDRLVEVVGRAAAQARTMREVEGARLAADLADRLDSMQRIVERIEALAPERLVRERDRLRESIDHLLDDRTEVDEERIAREVAHMADRWDIHEELVRFRSHLALFRETLVAGSDDGVGKRFSFIGQEILREANTMGSKANDADIAREVVLLKGEIERVREQVENVE